MFKQTLLPLALTGLLISGPALAHAKLEHTSPAKDSTVMAPKTLGMTFGDPVTLTSLKLSHDGKTVPLDVKAKTATSFSVPVPMLAPGLYSVRWSAVSEEDGHAMTGAFAFRVKAK
ncbi:MAG TPA: copper resistance CopC family protein [Alphaproteobacteria bacterium]|nr:copper resistance CopC family protein [Alphaproteobacteria bacterium]